MICLPNNTDHDAVLTLEKRLQTSRNSVLAGESNEYVLHTPCLVLVMIFNRKDLNFRPKTGALLCFTISTLC